MLDLLIINGTYPDFGNYMTGIDNEGSQMKRANIGIKDGVIAYVGEGEPEAAEVFDAEGLVVSPGFIDIHMHEERFYEEGHVYFAADKMLNQGVTTAVAGNCGSHRQPIGEFKSILAELGGSPVNYMIQSGYNYFRTHMGIGNHEKSTIAQRIEIRDRIMRELDQGACGVSFGIEYDPAMTFEEMLFAVDLIEDPDMFVSAHYRDEDHVNTDNVDEMIRFSREIRPRFQISHLSSCCAFDLMGLCLDHINQAMKTDPGLNFDTYPYNAFSTQIGSAVFEEDCFDTWGTSYDCILLTSDPYKNVRCDEAIFRDARKNHPDMLAVAFVMKEESIRMAVVNPNGMVASDGLMRFGHGHPRIAGTFPRVLGKYVRSEQAISLVDALRKMTLEPAERVNLANKGRIKEGADADITIFDPGTVSDVEDWTELRDPVGIVRTYICGKLARERGVTVNGRLGRFIPYQGGK